MKYNYLLVALVLVGLCSAAHAQKDDDKPALITFTAGWSNATFNGDFDGVSLENRNGFFAGVRKDVKLVPMLFLNTGLLYTQQGTSFSTSGIDDWKLNYIDIPVGLKFKIGPVFATGGVSANFKISEDFGNLDSEFEPDIKSFDMAYSLGLGAKFLMFSLDLRWNNSFGDIIKDNEGDAIGNSYFLVGLGFSIHRN